MTDGNIRSVISGDELIRLVKLACGNYWLVILADENIWLEILSDGNIRLVLLAGREI